MGKGIKKLWMCSAVMVSLCMLTACGGGAGSRVGIYTQTVTDEIEGEETEAVYEVRLEDDNTGVLSFQDDVAVTWDDKTITTEDGSATYPYTIKGNTLTMECDGQELVFTKSDAK